MRFVLRCAVLTVLVALGLGPGLSAFSTGSLRFVRNTMDQGLSNNSVYCLHQDRAGFLWFGTFAGLNRYDGTGFQVYKPGRPAEGNPSLGNLQGSVVFALEEDLGGRLWVGTDGGGLSRYDRASDSFETFRSGQGSTALASNRIFCLAADPGGDLWIGLGGGGLARREAASGIIQRIGAPPWARFTSVRCLLVQPGAGLLVGTEDAGLLRYSHETFSAIHLAGAWKGNDTIRALASGPDHRIWVGTAAGAVEVLDPGSDRAVDALPPGPSTVRALAFDSLGRLWVGYEGDGVAVLDVTGARPRAVARDVSLGNVRAIGTDRNGLVWVTLKDGGIVSHDPESERFTRFALSSVRGLAETRSGDILAGTDGSGLYRIAPGRAPVREALPRGYERVYSVLEDRRGALWIGTDGMGLLVRDAKGGLRAFRRNPADPHSLSSDVVWALLEDRAGSLWVGTEGGGLDRWNPARGGFDHFRPRPGDPSSLLGSSVRTLQQSSDGRLWVGTWDGGLSRMDPATGTFERFPELADSSVNTVLEDSQHRLWVGTGSAGLARLGPGRDFRYLAKKDGLSGDTVTGLMEDREGFLWVATAERLTRYDPRTGSLFHFGEEDGLADSEGSQNAYLRTRGGAIWVGGPAGLSRFNPESVQPANRPPEIVFTRIEAYGAEGPQLMPLGDGTGRIPTVELDWRNTGIRFTAALLDFIAPARNRFEMRVEGLGREWIPLGEQHETVIPPLPPGTFTVHLRGTDSNGVATVSDAVFTVQVRPPFWRRPVVIGAAALALAGLAIGAMLLRMRVLHRRTEILRSYSRHIQEAREEERIAAARDVHDEIGQHLAALNLQAHWVSTHPDAPAVLRTERVEEMLGSISEAMDAVKSVATSLRPIALDALTFHEAASWYVRTFGHRSGMTVIPEIPEDFPKLEGPLATALFRVLQEMLSNVSRHAEASQVRVKLEHGAGRLALSVSDNGRGILPGKADADDSFGIIGMRERCAAFGGTLEVMGGPGPGTTFTARVPFPESGKGRA